MAGPADPVRDRPGSPCDPVAGGSDLLQDGLVRTGDDRLCRRAVSDPRAEHVRIHGQFLRRILHRSRDVDAVHVLAWVPHQRGGDLLGGARPPERLATTIIHVTRQPLVAAISDDRCPIGEPHLEARSPFEHVGDRHDRNGGPVGMEHEVPLVQLTDRRPAGWGWDLRVERERLPLDASYEVVRQPDAFERAAEDELTGVEHEGAFVVDLDEPGELLEVLLHVDDGHRVVEEHTEELVQANVDRRGLDQRLVGWVENDAAGGQLLTDAPVGQDHGRRT